MLTERRFMPADAFWTLAMAVNVYLTFYYKFDAERLRRMEIPYIVCCYGIPLVPALTYMFVRNDNSDRVYGNAALWCWVTKQWEIWRILTFYGPVWLVILITFFIYIRTGGDIYRKRKQLQGFSSHDAEGVSSLNGMFASVKTTEADTVRPIQRYTEGGTRPAPSAPQVTARRRNYKKNNAAWMY
ncbi:hypothetical protein VD0003_g9645 [Verticillium dahliae]|nr:hypothetical protein VD0003_g9645 [Verticillium dahliae]